jgi:hypothetical protein
MFRRDTFDEVMMGAFMALGRDSALLHFSVT